MSVQSIQLEDVKEGTAIEFRKSTEQPQSRSFLPFVGLKPFEGEESLYWAAGDLAAYGSVIVLQLLCFDPVLPHHDPALQARITAAAVTGKHFNAVEGGHDTALHPAGIERFIAFERSIHVHQHGFQP